MLPYKEILRRIKNRYNIEEDEMKVLGHDTEEKVRAYYILLLGSKHIDADDEEGEKMPEDKFKLNKKSLDYVNKQEKAQKAIDDKRKQAQLASQVARDQQQLPPDEQVSLKEVNEAMQELRKPVKAIKPSRKKD